MTKFSMLLPAAAAIAISGGLVLATGGVANANHENVLVACTQQDVDTGNNWVENREGDPIVEPGDTFYVRGYSTNQVDADAPGQKTTISTSISTGTTVYRHQGFGGNHQYCILATGDPTIGISDIQGPGNSSPPPGFEDKIEDALLGD